MTSESLKSQSYAGIWYFLRRYKGLYVATLILMLLGSILESVSILAFFPLFTYVLNESGDTPGGVLGVIMDIVDLVPIGSTMIAASLLLISVLILKAVFNFARDAFIAYFAAKVMYASKKQVWERYAAADYLYILGKKQGDLIYNSLDASGSPSIVFRTASGMATSFLKVVAITIVLLSIMPWAALAVACMGLVYYTFIHFLSKKISYRLGRVIAKAATSQVVITNEFLAGFRHIIASNASQPWVDRFDTENRMHAEAAAKEMVWNTVPRPIVELTVVATMIGIAIGLWFYSSNDIAETLPKAGLFCVSLVQLMGPISSFGQSRMSLMSSLPRLQIAYEAITSYIPSRKDGERVLESFEKAISFENLSFTYPGREKLFKDLTLDIEKGKITAIVGLSGSGKTTLANLILGLFEPTAGRITVDGIPLQELKRETWLGKIGFVSQDPFTYHSSITENIGFGRDNHSQESIVRAAKLANAHEFISEHPDGYNAIVGDRGMRLSGGQQQRLAIARALLGNPEILIFDEATSSLDTISEKQVQEAIGWVSNNRTVIIIAHRLSTIKNADEIIVLQNGQVIEQGRHQDLLNNDGLYSRLAASGEQSANTQSLENTTGND